MVSCPTCPKNLEWYLINRGHSERRGREEMSAISRVSLISQWSIIEKFCQSSKRMNTLWILGFHTNILWKLTNKKRDFRGSKKQKVCTAYQL